MDVTDPQWIDPKWVDLGLQLLQTVFFVIVGFIAWINSKGKAATDEVKEVREDLQAVDERRRTDRTEMEKRISDDKQDLIKRFDSLKSDVSQRVDTIEMDVREIRTTLGHLPGDDDLKELHDRITTLSENLGSKVGEMNGTLESVNSTVVRLNDYLLNNKGKG